MRFNYQAKTKTGEIQAGVIQAPSKEAALALLQKHELYVTFLEEAEVIPAWIKKIRIFKRISRKELVAFTRELSILFRSKVPLVESLRTLAAQTESAIFREKILDLATEVEGGTLFSKALARHPDLFSPFYIGLIRSGEASGTLSESLEYLADHLEREYDLTSKIKGAMIYPALLIMVMVFIAVLMSNFVLPQLIEILQAIPGVELPLITKLIIWGTGFIRSWGWLFLLIIAGLGFLAFQYSKTAEGKKLFDQNILKTPIIGSFAKTIYLARAAENLATLIRGGIPIVQALKITSEVVGNDVYRSIISKTSEEVKTGGTISSVLSKFPEEFPPLFIQMVTIGEKTGTLDKSLQHLVRLYKKETDRAVDGLLAILEPVLIIFLGVGVGIVVMGILIPLYQSITL